MALHFETMSRFMHQNLLELMRSPQLQQFALGDTTALSLKYGHRMSNELDLYSPQVFQETDLQRVRQYLQASFGNTEQHVFQPKKHGTSLFLYNLNKDAVKIDVYFSAPNTASTETIENIRFLGQDDLHAQLLENIRITGSKSHFWDLHFLLGKFSLNELIDAYKKRYPEQSVSELKKKLTHFSRADEEPDPKCLLGKNWNLIKLDLTDSVKGNK